MSSRSKIAAHFHRLAQITRTEIFGSADATYAPINLPVDTATMFAGFVGRSYVPGKGVLLLAINPGGGGDTYISRAEEDDVFYPKLIAFKKATGTEIQIAFESVNDTFESIVQCWNLWKILQPTLEATKRSLAEVAYMNVVPYRTRNDRKPPVAAQKAAWQNIIQPSLEVLDPSAIVTLGKKAGAVVEKFYNGNRHLYCIPRTNGDSRISPEAREVHDRMKQEFQ